LRRLVDHEPNKHNNDTDHVDCKLEPDSEVGFHKWTEDDHITYLDWDKHYKTTGKRHPNYFPKQFNIWEKYNWEDLTFRPNETDPDSGPDSSTNVLTDADVAELLTEIQNQNAKDNTHGQRNPYLDWLTKQENDMCTDGMRAFHSELKNSTSKDGDASKLGELFIAQPIFSILYAFK